MNRYEESEDVAVEKLAFAYLDSWWSGSGFMRWDPDLGFRVQAMLESGSLPKNVGMGHIGPPMTEDRRMVRLRLNHRSKWAVIPGVVLRDRFDIAFGKQLDLRASRLLWSEQSYQSADADRWVGTVRIATAQNAILPHQVERKRVIGGKEIDGGISASGLRIECDDGQFVLGELQPNGDVLISFGLPKTVWNKTEAWRWPQAATQAFGMLRNEGSLLLERVVDRPPNRFVDRRRRIDPDSFYPFAFIQFDGPLDPDKFLLLANFLARDTEESALASRIHEQVIAAGIQKNWHALELLMATTLEAALRTWERHPFVHRDKSFNLGQSLDRFAAQHLGPEWDAAVQEVKRRYFTVRDRNAHPDWLFEQTGWLDDNQRSQAFRDLMLLSQFYGYMVLGLAGVKDLNPEFFGNAQG